LTPAWIRVFPWPALMAALAMAACLLPGQAGAQLTYLDEIPWFAPADSTSRLAMVAEVNRFEDAKYDWSVNRLHVCAILPAGDRSVYFLRMSHLNFSTGGLLPVVRWPWIRGEEEKFPWADETTITSFGQPEIGATGPVVIPGMAHWHYGVAFGLPVGSDHLYPFASVSMPLRLALRRVFWPRPGLQLGLTGTYLLNMDSGKDLLSGNAFPGGWKLGGVANLFGGRGSRWSVTYDFESRQGRRSQLLGLQKWFAWTPDGSLGVKVARELQGTLHGPAAWYFTLAWRFDSPGRRPAAEAEAEAAE
jgi:hypothetical protein